MLQNSPKIIFFGTSQFAVPALEALVKAGYEIAAAATQPDKPTGRKQVLSSPPVKICAEQQGIKVLQPKTLKDDETFETFKLLNPGICIVAAYGKIIPKRYLDVPKYGFINIHPSLLPKYRGPSPIQTTILNDDKEAGVTIMVVDEEMDHGPILESRKWKVESGKYYKELEKELAKLGAELLIETLPKYINGEIKPKPQDLSQATFTKMFKRDDGRIDWNKPAQKTHNQIRALNPEPGTWTIWNGKIINILTCNIGYQQIGSVELKKPGTVIKIGGNIVIAAGKDYLSLELIQFEGGKVMTVKEFINGHRNFIGSTLK